MLTGLANSAIGWVIIAVCLLAGMSGFAANAAGYAVGIVCAFTLNRHYVFGIRGPISGTEITRFLVVFMIAYGANVATLLVAQSLAGDQGFITQIPALVTYSLVFFVLSQVLVFKSTVTR